MGEVGSSAPKPGSKGGNSSPDSAGSSSKAKRPQPVDLTVPAGVSVVAVTGPNTGKWGVKWLAVLLQACLPTLQSCHFCVHA